MVKSNQKKNWQTVSIPAGVLKRLEVYLESDEAAHSGFISKSDVITFILREYLNNWEKSKGGGR